MASNSNERKSQCILFNMKQNCEKINNIEAAEEIEYLGVIVQAKKKCLKDETTK